MAGFGLLGQETPFFLSYPRTDAQSGGRAGSRCSDPLVRRFFAELCGEVAPLVHLPYFSEVGFMDVDGLSGGMNWHPGLTRALGTCQVLVSLLSAPYLMRARKEGAVSEIVWQLAKLIQQIYYRQRLEPRAFESCELTNIFRRGENDE